MGRALSRASATTCLHQIHRPRIRHGLRARGYRAAGLRHVGLHLIGWPEMFAKPPYEEQAHRLFARFEDLRTRLPRDDEEWMGRLYEAWQQFERDGSLPDDELMGEGALALAEAFELMRCAVDEGSAQRMAEF